MGRSYGCQLQDLVVTGLAGLVEPVDGEDAARGRGEAGAGLGDVDDVEELVGAVGADGEAAGAGLQLGAA